MKLAFALVGGFAVFVALMLGLGWISFSNDANSYEVQIKNKYTDNQNVYDNGWKKVKEMAQVPTMQTQALADLYDKTMKGRYGAGGSKALFQFIQEQNPNLDQTTFVKIQRAVEDFHNEFQSNQTRLISIRQSYEQFLTATTSGRLYNNFSHYPHIDLDAYGIVTSDKTQTDFSKKKADELKLN